MLKFFLTTQGAPGCKKNVRRTFLITGKKNCLFFHEMNGQIERQTYKNGMNELLNCFQLRKTNGQINHNLKLFILYENNNDYKI